MLEFFNDDKKYKKANVVKEGFKTLLNLINKKNMDSEFTFNDITTIFCGLPVFLLTFESRELLISKFEGKKYPKSGIAGDISKCFLGLLAHMKVLNQLNVSSGERILKLQATSTEKKEIKTGDFKASKIEILGQGPSLSLIELFNDTKLAFSTKTFRLIAENNITVFQNVQIPFFDNSSTFSLKKILEYCFSNNYDYSKYYVLYVKPQSANSVLAIPVEEVQKSDLLDEERVDIHIIKKVKELDDNSYFCFFNIADDLVSACKTFKTDKLIEVSGARKILHNFQMWQEIQKEAKKIEKLKKVTNDNLF